MCGILGAVIHDGNNDLKSILLPGLRAVEYRGYDSAGIAVMNGDGISVNKKAGKLSILEDFLGETPIVGNVGMGHTRWATHGIPNDENAHPHWDHKKRVILVHNGIIENYADLKDELLAKGVVFSSETDTEVAVNLIASYYENDLPAAVREAGRRFKGSFSMCVMAVDQPHLLVGLRHEVPLLVGHGETATYLASDITAFLAYTRDVTYLEDGEMAVLTDTGTHYYELQSGKEIDKKIERVEWNIEQAQKGGYDTFMMKEIHEQPSVIRQLLERHLPSADEPVHLPQLDELTKDNEFRLISLLGCGTAFHACKVGKYVLEGLAKIPCRVMYAHEALYHQAPISSAALTIAVSQSGETADTLGAVKSQKAAGSKIVSICNVVGSSLTRISDQTLYTMAGPEISVASTKAFTCQLTMIYLVAIWIAEKFGRADAAELRHLKEELLAIPDKMYEIISNEKQIEHLARIYRQVRHFYYLGRGIAYPVAMEGALKLKEISYVHAEGYAGGEMKHGAIAMIEPGFPSCILAPKSPLLEKMVANMEEILSRNGEVMVITNAPERFSKYDVHVFSFPDCPQVFSPLLMSVPLQVFAFYSAKLRGRDIDQPRNLAKSVVVE